MFRPFLPDSQIPTKWLVYNPHPDTSMMISLADKYLVDYVHTESIVWAVIMALHTIIAANRTLFRYLLDCGKNKGGTFTGANAGLAAGEII